MQKDFIVGLTCSALLHAGIFLSDQWMAKPAVRILPLPADPVSGIRITPPPPEPEKEDPVAELRDDPIVNPRAIPSLTDIAAEVPINALTQLIQPPPPPGLTTDRGAVSIPVAKTYARLSGDRKDIFEVGSLDQVPVLRVPVNPAYPFAMRQAGIGGEVLVEFIVDTKGNVVAVQANRSTHREFEQPALQAVQKWKFRPGRKNGHAVNTRVQQTITFTLSDE